MKKLKSLYLAYLNFSYDYSNIHASAVMVLVYLSIFGGLFVWSLFQ